MIGFGSGLPAKIDCRWLGRRRARGPPRFLRRQSSMPSRGIRAARPSTPHGQARRHSHRGPHPRLRHLGRRGLRTSFGLRRRAGRRGRPQRRADRRRPLRRRVAARRTSATPTPAKASPAALTPPAHRWGKRRRPCRGLSLQRVDRLALASWPASPGLLLFVVARRFRRRAA